MAIRAPLALLIERERLLRIEASPHVIPQLQPDHFIVSVLRRIDPVLVLSALDPTEPVHEIPSALRLANPEDVA